MQYAGCHDSSMQMKQSPERIPDVRMRCILRAVAATVVFLLAWSLKDPIRYHPLLIGLYTYLSSP